MTNHPEYTKELIQQSKKVRFDPEEQEDQSNLIEIDPAFEEELKAFPQFTSK